MFAIIIILPPVKNCSQKYWNKQFRMRCLEYDDTQNLEKFGLYTQLSKNYLHDISDLQSQTKKIECFHFGNFDDFESCTKSLLLNQC